MRVQVSSLTPNFLGGNIMKQLKKDVVLKIRDEKRSGSSVSDIAWKNNLSKSTVSKYTFDIKRTVNR